MLPTNPVAASDGGVGGRGVANSRPPLGATVPATKKRRWGGGGDAGRSGGGSNGSNNGARAPPPPKRGGGRVTFARAPQDPKKEQDEGRDGNNPEPEEEPDDEEEGERAEPWPASLHRHLVEALYEVGLKHASPAVLMETMGPNLAEDVTSERVKSHLQKYRNNKDRNKEDFLREYDEWMAHVRSTGGSPLPLPGGSSSSSSSALFDTARSQHGPPDRLHGGDRAALLTHAVLAEQAAAAAIRSHLPQHEFVFPVLSEAEKRTPLGEALTHAMRLFEPLAQCVRDERGGGSGVGGDCDLLGGSGSIVHQHDGSIGGGHPPASSPFRPRPVADDPAEPPSDGFSAAAAAFFALLGGGDASAPPPLPAPSPDAVNNNHILPPPPPPLAPSSDENVVHQHGDSR